VIEFKINGTKVTSASPEDTPLLWVVRDELGLKGTKYGCGIAQCGACTVHLNGDPVRSCSVPVSVADGKAITTIEGLDSPVGEALKDAWVAEQVPQCGYCQSGQIMSAVALLEKTTKPSDEDIDSAMSGNVCRCGMYGRIRKAIKTASTKLSEEVILTPIDNVAAQEGTNNG